MNRKVVISKDSAPELKEKNTVYLQVTEKYTEEQILESILMEKGARFVIENNIIK